MDRRRLIVAGLLSAVALAWCLARIDVHGLWFDEAYTARIAALSPERVLRGALADIHPPGWPLISAIFLRLPLSAEVALRLPSTLAFAALVGWLASRRPLAGVAALFAAPLVDQATQGRPYLLLTAGLVLCSELLTRRRWGWAGLVAGAVASLHALGGALVLPVLLVHAVRARPDRAALLRGVGGVLVLVSGWAPAFVTRSMQYLDQPWYTPADSSAWWVLTDGRLGLAGVIVWLLTQRRRSFFGIFPGIAVLATLVILASLGVGVEIHKTGIVVLPLLLAGAAPEELDRRAWLGQIALVLGLALGSVPLDDRPDLRQAAGAVAELGGEIPVVAVFASEAAWYIRTPAPIPSRRDPDGILQRIEEVLGAQRQDCVAAISLPGTIPDEASLRPGLHTVAVAEVTGLDVRLVGSEACAVPASASGWSRAMR